MYESIEPISFIVYCVLMQVVIEESTIQQYNDLGPPMTDTEAFSSVLGVLARFKWQFVDRTPHTSDLPPGTDPSQVKQVVLARSI